jgi:hypothetical protein
MIRSAKPMKADVYRRRQMSKENCGAARKTDGPSHKPPVSARDERSAWANPAKMRGAIVAGLVTGLIAYGVSGAARHINIDVQSERYTVAIVVTVSWATTFGNAP